jgi:hypothetical protein
MYAENANYFEVIEIVTVYNLLVTVYCATGYGYYVDQILKENKIIWNVCVISIFQIHDNITLEQYIQLFVSHIAINV